MGVLPRSGSLPNVTIGRQGRILAPTSRRSKTLVYEPADRLSKESIRLGQVGPVSTPLSPSPFRRNLRQPLREGRRAQSAPPPPRRVRQLQRRHPLCVLVSFTVSSIPDTYRPPLVRALRSRQQRRVSRFPQQPPFAGRDIYTCPSRTFPNLDPTESTSAVMRRSWPELRTTPRSRPPCSLPCSRKSLADGKLPPGSPNSSLPGSVRSRTRSPDFSDRVAGHWPTTPALPCASARCTRRLRAASVCARLNALIQR